MPLRSDGRGAVVRASSFAELFRCSLRWAYKHIDGVTGPASGAAWIGTSLHKGAALLDRREGGAKEAVECYIDSLTNPGEEVRWTADDTPRAAAGAIGAQLLHRYAKTVTPGRTWLAVEMECEPVTVDTPNGAITFTGTTDRVSEENGALSVEDLKSGKAAVLPDGAAKVEGHGPQLEIYRLLASATLERQITGPGRIIGLNVRADDPAIGFGSVNYFDQMWDPEMGLVTMAAGIINRGDFRPNPSDMLCSEKYCPAWGACKYHY